MSDLPRPDEIVRRAGMLRFEHYTKQGTEPLPWEQLTDAQKAPWIVASARAAETRAYCAPCGHVDTRHDPWNGCRALDKFGHVCGCPSFEFDASTDDERPLLAQRLFVAMVEARNIDAQKYGEFQCEPIRPEHAWAELNSVVGRPPRTGGAS